MVSGWLKILQKQFKARQSRQNQVYMAFSSLNRYDVTLANHRAPGV